MSIKAFSSDRSGQALLLTVIALGGTLLGATTIAGLLMLYQIRQATDLKDSNKAIFAADAGLELANYTLRFPAREVPLGEQPLLDENGNGNGAVISQIICYSATSTEPDTVMDPCLDDGSVAPLVIRSYGEAGRANRAFQQ